MKMVICMFVSLSFLIFQWKKFVNIGNTVTMLKFINRLPYSSIVYGHATETYLRPYQTSMTEVLRENS